MPVTIVPFPRKALKHGLPRRLPRLFELRQTLRMVLKDRRYFYLKQGRSFVGLRDEYPLPHAIEIETINKCNSTCSFCPVNRFADTRPLARMPEELFRKIIDDLASHRYSGLLALYSNNEPFLDNRIFDFAAYARRVLPQATISIFTNGSALDIAKVERILPSLDILRINNYGRTPELHPNIGRIVEHLNAGPLKHSRKVQVHYRLLAEFNSSRGGNAPNRQRFLATYRSRCAYPFYQMVVRPDGKLSLCCNDALGHETLGDLSAQSVSEAWNDHRRRTVQDLMLKGRDKLDLCRHCDNQHVAKPARVASRDLY
ncbi:MAG TPA: SPASM domain-containing protein [Terriglobales bacterium]|nr:SPASM domain-containing protein [Terriglobales bacterium]